MRKYTLSNSENEKKKEQDSSEKQKIKRLEESLSYLRKLYSKEREEDDHLVKVFVAERNLRGHLQNLGSFLLHEERIDWLQEEVKEGYGPGRYCVSLQKGKWRSRGVDILIGGTRSESKAAKQKPFSKMSMDERNQLIAKIMVKAGVTVKDLARWHENYMKRGYVLFDENPEKITEPTTPHHED